MNNLSNHTAESNDKGFELRDSKFEEITANGVHAFGLSNGSVSLDLFRRLGETADNEVANNLEIREKVCRLNLPIKDYLRFALLVHSHAVALMEAGERLNAEEPEPS